MRVFSLILLLVFLFIPFISYSKVTFFPVKDPIINTHTALLNSFEGLDVIYMNDRRAKTNLIGPQFAIKTVLLDFKGKTYTIDISMLGRVSTRFRLGSESFNLIHVDYVGGLGFDIKLDNLILETVIYHTSSHLGDDAIVQENEQYVNAGWEAVKQYINYRFNDWFFGSIGFEYKFGTRPKDRIYYKYAGFIGGKLDFLSAGVPIFLESELEIPDFQRSPNFGIKVGIYLHYLVNNLLMERKILKEEKHILYFQYYHGTSKIGYQYNRKEDLFIIGRTFRF